MHFWLRNRAQRLQDERLAQGMEEMTHFKQFEVYDRYYSMHLRAFNKAFSDLLRLKSFQIRQEKEAALMERRNKEAEIRFKSQQQKSEAHAVKMETLNLKLEAQKIRNQRLPKTKTAAPAVEAVLPNGAFFLAESSTGKIRILRGLNADHEADQNEVFAAGLNRPFVSAMLVASYGRCQLIHAQSILGQSSLAYIQPVVERVRFLHGRIADPVISAPGVCLPGNRQRQTTRQQLEP